MFNLLVAIFRVMKLNTLYRSTLTRLLPHVCIVAGFYVLTWLVFAPAYFQKKSFSQNDIQQYRASISSIETYANTSSETVFWNPNLFSGMPTYLSGLDWRNPLLAWLHKVGMLGLPHPMGLFFLCLLWSYLLGIGLGLTPLAALGGSLAYGASSYFLIGLGAGHNARMAAMAYLPMIMLAIRLGYTQRILLGAPLLGLAIALQFQANHVQISYYTVFAAAIYALFILIKAYMSTERRRSACKRFFIHSAVLAGFALLGFSTYYGKFQGLYDYAQHSIRGTRILSKPGADGVVLPKEGLDKDYAFSYSNAPMESMTLVVPNFYGGTSAMELKPNSALGKAFKAQGVPKNQLKAVPTYWGDQPITTPYYMGATVLILFLFACFYLPWRQKGWLITLGVFAILLTWGKHFSVLNYTLFDWLPGYNKFRSPTFATALVLLAGGLLAAYGIDNIGRKSTRSWKQALIRGGGLGIGLMLAVLLFSGMGSFKGAIDSQLSSYPNWYMEALRLDRLRLLRADALRGLIFCLLSVGALYLIGSRQVGKTLGGLILVALLFVDVWPVTWRYFNWENNFKEAHERLLFPSTKADKRILDAQDSLSPRPQRVFDLRNPFNDNRPSIQHHSVGGYHAAKLRRYQDLIEYGLSQERERLIDSLRADARSLPKLPVCNMLNVGHFVYGPKAGQVIGNASSCGGAWFASRLILVSGPDEEIETLGTLPACEVVVWDTATQKYPPRTSFDPTEAQVRLEKATPNELVFSLQQIHSEQLLVLSEIHYPKWKVYVDDKEQPLLRVNYLLRALRLAPGSKKVRLRFEDPTYQVGKSISWISSLLLIGLVLLVFGRQGYYLSKEANADKPSLNPKPDAKPDPKSDSGPEHPDEKGGGGEED